MKKLVALLTIFSLICSISFAQKTETTAIDKAKPAAPVLYNDLYGGYGGFSLFYFTGVASGSFDLVRSEHLNDIQSAGTFFLGYQRSLNKVVSTGFLIAYQNFHRSGTGYSSNSGTTVPLTVDNNLLMGLARVTFCYLNKRAIRMYSGVGIGITINLMKQKVESTSSSDRALLPGGELTLMGLRFGRAFGGFVEFGIGTYGIINAGLSYKFSD